jgi:hypothetical protein
MSWFEVTERRHKIEFFCNVIPKQSLYLRMNIMYQDSLGCLNFGYGNKDDERNVRTIVHDLMVYKTNEIRYQALI